MASTLIVETGVGVSNADSYISLVNADAYVSAYSSSSALWLAATEAARDLALRQAAQYLDNKYRDMYKGKRYSRTQALLWPRDYVYDENGIMVNYNEIPVELQNAQVELALAVIVDGDSLMPNMSDAGIVTQESISVGPLSSTITYAGGRGLFKKFTKVESLLKGLLCSSSGILRA